MLRRLATRPFVLAVLLVATVSGIAQPHTDVQAADDALYASVTGPALGEPPGPADETPSEVLFHSNVVYSPDERSGVTDTTVAPWRQIVLLEITFSSGRGRCTGFMLGPHTVGTAAHCVYDRKDRAGWATSIRVIPGANGNVAPVGSAVGVQTRATRGWVESGDSRADFAAVILGSDQLGNAGTFGVRVRSEPELMQSLLNHAGYPGDKPEKTMWATKGRLQAVDDFYIYPKFSAYFGQSGGPVWESDGNTHSIVGIFTSSSEALQLNRAVRITASVASVLATWRDLPIPTGPPAPNPTAPPSSTQGTVRGGAYSGVTTEVGTVAATVSSDGRTLSSLTVTYPPESVPAGCGSSTTVGNVSIVGGEASGSITVSSAASTSTVAFEASFMEDGLGVGSVTVVPVTPANCPRREVIWVAVTRTSAEPPPGNATFGGPAVVVQFSGSTSDGIVALTTNQGATALSRFTLTVSPTCASADVGSYQPPIVDGRAHFVRRRGSAETTPLEARYILAFSGSTVTGVFVDDQSYRGCMPIIGFFTASVEAAPPPPAASPTPPPSATPPSPTPPAAVGTPAPGATSGLIIAGSIPPAGGFGLIVFGGGSAEQLVAASGCPTATAVFWVADGGNFVTYVPGATIAVVNAEWNARFPNGIPAGTPMIGRCR